MSLRHSTLLIVEEDEEVLALLEPMFSEQYQIVIVGNKEEAITSIDQMEPDELDLVLLDVSKSAVERMELLGWLHENLRTEGVPVILLSAQHEEKLVHEGLASGAIDYIIKPFDPELLKLKVRNHIKQKQCQDRLHDTSMIDVVTSLYNRRLFDIRIEDEWQRSMRHRREMAVMMVDIDEFQQFNDSYGQSAGDRCLAKIANEIQSVFRRSSDFVAHYGKDEFVVILPECGLRVVSELAEKVQRQIEQLQIPNQSSKILEVVTVSIGVASVVADHSSTYKQLINLAERRLHEARSAGCNCVRPSVDFGKIVWDETFSVGHPVMDQHHQTLINYINELTDLYQQQDQGSQLIALLSKLNSFAEMHMEAEELMLKTVNFLVLEKHHLQHQHYRRVLTQFSSRGRSMLVMQELIMLLRQWWENHILEEDMAYKPFVSAAYAEVGNNIHKLSLPG